MRVRRFTHDRPHRLSGVPYVGPARYFLTICTKDRLDAFREEVVAIPTVDQFLTTARAESFAVLAYCLMPDHIHLLVEGTSSESNLQRFVKLSKQRSGFTYARMARKRLWQDGYFERVLRRDEDAREIARYILENPVRAGLVEWPADYRYLGSTVWTIDALLEGVSKS